MFKFQFHIMRMSGIRSLNLIPFSEPLIVNGKVRLSEIFANVFVFAPVGVYTCMLKPGWSFVKKVFPGLAISLIFETMQYILAIGASDITDVISNTLGTVIGILVFQLLFSVLGAKTVKLFNILALAATVAAVAFLGILIVANL